MEIWTVETDKAPAAIGPYSQAVTTDGYVFCSGASVADQTRQALENLSAVLAAAGTTLGHVVKTTIYLANMDDFSTVNDVYTTFFDQNPPARVTVGVAALPKGALVEIDCIARV
jgi:2-iminobutanoate/2-iminopropanoate deaminase